MRQINEWRKLSWGDGKIKVCDKACDFPIVENNEFTVQ